MKILGIIFIVLSVIVFSWINPTKRVIDKPLFAANPVANLIVSLIWLALLISGIYLLFQ